MKTKTTTRTQIAAFRARKEMATPAEERLQEAVANIAYYRREMLAQIEKAMAASAEVSIENGGDDLDGLSRVMEILAFTAPGDEDRMVAYLTGEGV